MPRTIKTGVPQGSSRSRFFSCYLVSLEVLFKRLDVNYRFYADNTVIYFASINQGAFDLILTTLQKWFSGAKLRLSRCLIVDRIVQIAILNFQQTPIFLTMLLCCAST